MGSNEERMGSRAYIGGRAGRPRGGRQAPVSPVGGAPSRPRGGDRPSYPYAPPARDLVANLKKKNYI